MAGMGPRRRAVTMTPQGATSIHWSRSDMGPRQSVADAQTANTQRGSEIGVRPTTPADTSTEYPLSLLPRSRPRPSTIADHGFDDALTSISADPADELKRVTVSRNDCLYAGPRPRYLVGPLDNLDDSRQLRDRLRVIASGGPSNRVGLLPDPMSRSWQFDSTARSAAVSITEAATLDIRDPARAIADFAIEPKNRAPLHIHLARPWVLLDFDHGLGGGKLMSELI